MYKVVRLNSPFGLISTPTLLFNFWTLKTFFKPLMLFMTFRQNLCWQVIVSLERSPIFHPLSYLSYIPLLFLYVLLIVVKSILDPWNAISGEAIHLFSLVRKTRLLFALLHILTAIIISLTGSANLFIPTLSENVQTFLVH